MEDILHGLMVTRLRPLSVIGNFLNLSNKNHKLFSFSTEDIQLLENYGIHLSDIHFMTDFLNEKYFF